MAQRVRKHQPDFSPLNSFPKVSVIIVTYNLGGKFIEPCMAALRALDYPDYEIIILDNNSRDDTPEMLKRCCGGARLFLNGENRGFGGGCNDGAQHANGQVLVFLNADTEVDPLWLRNLIRPMVDDRRVAITGCKMYFPGRRLLQHAGGILHGNGMTEHYGYRQEDAGQFDVERDVDFVTGAGIAMRREFFEMCGGFDEDYYPAYCEELDLCYRAHLMGYRVIYAPRAVLIHHESPLLGNQSPMFQRLMYRGRMIFCLKNYRLRDWLFRFIPVEYWWLRIPASKGYRKKQIRAYLDMLKFMLGHRLTPRNPLPK